PSGWTTYPSLAECQGTTPTCAEGQTKSAGDGCNTCSCSGGQWMCTLMACVADASVPKTCGGFAGFTCDSTEYCAYVEGQMCGAADASAVCKPRPDGCTTDVNPVCGCDGK